MVKAKDLTKQLEVQKNELEGDLPAEVHSLEEIETTLHNKFEEPAQPKETFIRAHQYIQQTSEVPDVEPIDHDFVDNTQMQNAPDGNAHTLDDLTKEQPKVTTEEPEVSDTQVELHIPNLRSKQLNQSAVAGQPPTAYGFSRNTRFTPVDRKGGGATKLHVFVLVIIGLSVILGTVYLLKSQFSGKETVAGVVEEVTPTPIPTPTPTSQPIDRSKYTVRVLNGTIKAGLAASASSKLKELGYKVEKVANAPSQDYAQTVVSVKPGVEALFEQLVKDLSADFEASASGKKLAESDIADAQLILGSK